MFVFSFGAAKHSGKDIDFLVSKHISKILGVFSPVMILFKSVKWDVFGSFKT